MALVASPHVPLERVPSRRTWLDTLASLLDRRWFCWLCLACFFKSPMEVEEHDFFKQFALLEEYAQQVREEVIGEVHKKI